MRLIVRPIAKPWRDVRSWLLLAGVVLLWIMARIVVPTRAGAGLPGFRLLSCPLRTLTGIPCPFCGLTTGSSWMAHGEWRAAWASNILSPFLMIGSLILGVYAVAFRLAAARALSFELPPRTRWRFWLAGFALVAASWAVNLLRIIR